MTAANTLRRRPATTAGVVWIHASRRAMRTHLEWAVGHAVGDALRFVWQSQPVEAHAAARRARRETYAAKPGGCSPARIGNASRLPAGGSGQLYWSLIAHGGTIARLKSSSTEPSCRGRTNRKRPTS